MKFGLRTQLIGMLVGAIVIAAGIGALAARNTMAIDLNRLANQQVAGGATAFGGYWDQKRDSVKVLVGQTAVNDGVRRAAAAGGKGLQPTLSEIASRGGLSFLTVVDARGRVVARAGGGPTGTVLRSSPVDRALAGETVSSAAKLPAAQLAADGLAAQLEPRSAGRAGLREGLALIAATPISDAEERTVGAVYGGVLIDHSYDIVDQAEHALGGKAALIFDGQLISSTISRPDGTRLVDDAPPAALPSARAFAGVDREGGVDYLVRTEPVLDDRNQPLATRWFGVPLAGFEAIQQHVLVSLVLWGLGGALVALAFTVPLVERLARALIRRSKQVRASAQELGVVIVGSEVSGDHVSQTRAAIERQGDLLMRAAIETGTVPSGGGLALQAGVSERILAASALNAEILSDVMVIDTLAGEMALRTQQAVARVGELNEVAAGLDALVNGAKPGRDA